MIWPYASGAQANILDQTLFQHDFKIVGLRALDRRADRCGRGRAP
jgi:hypothetical protein